MVAATFATAPCGACVAAARWLRVVVRIRGADFFCFLKPACRGAARPLDFGQCTCLPASMSLTRCIASCIFAFTRHVRLEAFPWRLTPFWPFSNAVFSYMPVEKSLKRRREESVRDLPLLRWEDLRAMLCDYSIACVALAGDTRAWTDVAGPRARHAAPSWSRPKRGQTTDMRAPISAVRENEHLVQGALA